MRISKKITLTIIVLVNSVLYVPLHASEKEEQKLSWMQRMAYMVYEHRLKCAVIPLVVLGAKLQYRYGSQNLSNLGVVVSDTIYENCKSERSASEDSEPLVNLVYSVPRSWSRTGWSACVISQSFFDYWQKQHNPS